MLNVYTYTNITDLNYQTAGHTVKNPNAKLTIGVIGIEATLYISFDGVNWYTPFSSNLLSGSLTNLYMYPGIKNVSLKPDSKKSTSMQIMEFCDTDTLPVS